jgi:hypothetical protein
MALADKLQLRPGQSVAFVNAREDAAVNAREDAALELGGEHPVAETPEQADAVIVFTTNRAELEELGADFAAPARRGALTWVAYPKAGQLGTDLNRDVLAELVRAHAVRPVRQVAVDEVWSALRLRPG